MIHLVQFSTGIGSAEVAVFDRYDPEFDRVCPDCGGQT